jgi:Mrr restriction endonuclease-like protein
MPVIRIDQEVYAALQRHGRAFEDTPNDVLRRLLQLGQTAQPSPNSAQEKPMSLAPAGNTSSAKEGRVTPPRRRTKEAAFRRPILNALTVLGGRARVRDVLTHVESDVRAILAPVDHELLGNGEVRWENTAKWERKRMIGDGLLRADSPHGSWELTAQGREAASQPE